MINDMLLKKFFTMHEARKVPEVIILFWVIKLLTTAMGESTSDYLVHTMDPVIAVALGSIGFLIAIALQFWVKKYVAWIYWLTVTMVAICGTMAADVLHIVLGVPYFISSISFAILLAIVFTVWHRVEKTLSIHSIYTPRREVFYWLTVIVTFSLGTAAGDMTAITFHLGYIASGILFAFLFGVPLLFYKVFHTHEVFTFWAAYIMTRPFGASFADWFGRAPSAGGIGIGTGITSILLSILIIFFVGYLTLSHKDIKTKTV